jgi:glyoxylase-like metal-dependent hydrolase (beta-lactamase superfamily II)
MTEIAPGIYSMGQLKGAFVHAFLLEHDGELSLIDTLYDNDAHRVLREIKRAGREVADLKHIILTHAHRSHLGGLAWLKELSGATVYAHAWEADIIAGQRRAQCVTWRPGEPLAVRSRCCTRPVTRPATWPSTGPTGAPCSPATPSLPGPD